MEAVNPNDATTLYYKLSATLTSDLKTISNISILYNDKRINIVTDVRDQEVISTLSRALPKYLTTLDGIYNANSTQALNGDIRFFIDKGRIVI